MLDRQVTVCYYGQCTIVVRYGYNSLRRCMPKWRHCLTEKAVSKYIRGEMSMEKNRIKPTKSGRSMRMSYSRKKEVLDMPNLIDVQRDSYQWFLDEGLKEVFDDIPRSLTTADI